MNDITSFKTLIGSLYNKFNKARAYGKLDLKELYILDLVNDYLFGCPTCYNENTKRRLEQLSIQLQNLDKDICIYREDRDLYTNITGRYELPLNNGPIALRNDPPVVDDSEETEPVDPETIVLEVQNKDDITNAGYKTLNGFFISNAEPNDIVTLKLTYVNNGTTCPHEESLLAKDYSSGSNETSDLMFNNETIFLEVPIGPGGQSERWLFDFINIPSCLDPGIIYISILSAELSLINPENETISVNTL